MKIVESGISLLKKIIETCMRRKTASLFAKDKANALLLCQIPAAFISSGDQVKIIGWVRK